MAIICVNCCCVSCFSQSGGPGKGGSLLDRSITCGRMVCDVKISSKELIRCKSYDLTGVSSWALRNLIELTGKSEEQFPKRYCRSSVGQLLVVCRLTVCQLLAGRGPTVGRQTADSRPTVLVMFQTKVPTVGRQVTDSRKWEPLFAITNLPMTADKLYTSLTANTITAKLTNQSQRTRLISPSKRHTPTTVLSRTTFTQTITPYKLPNHLLLWSILGHL